MKQEIAPKTTIPQRDFALDGGGGGSAPRRRGKKILLGFMVAASICVVASWALFTVKPSWLAELKSRLSLTGAPTNKRSSVRYPSRPVFKVVQPQRTNPLPPSTPPIIAERMDRPQTFPSAIPPSTPPTTYPITRPQVSTPGAAGTPPSIPPSLAKGPPPATYQATRPEVTVPGAPGMSPSLSPPPASPFPGENQSPPAISSSLPSKKEESESDEYLEIATLYAQKGKYQKAEELFQKVAKEAPSSARAHNNLGVVRLKQEKYDMAEREFKEAMRLDPAFVLPYYNLACLYSRKGVDVESLIYLKKALKRDERVKQWVKTDKDFDKLRSDAVFQELLGGSPTKKEGAQKKEATQKTEGTQKLEGGQKKESVRQQDVPLKKEETLKPETQTQEKAPKMGLHKKEEIPPQSGPLQQVIPQQEEMQKQETPPAGAQNQEGTKGNAPQGAQGGDAQ